jgi:hypothetical protein
MSVFFSWASTEFKPGVPNGRPAARISYSSSARRARRPATSGASCVGPGMALTRSASVYQTGCSRQAVK